MSSSRFYAAAHQASIVTGVPIAGRMRHPEGEPRTMYSFINSETSEEYVLEKTQAAAIRALAIKIEKGEIK